MAAWQPEHMPGLRSEPPMSFKTLVHRRETGQGFFRFFLVALLTQQGKPVRRCNSVPVNDRDGSAWYRMEATEMFEGELQQGHPEVLY